MRDIDKSFEDQLKDQGFKRIPDKFDEDTGERMEVWEFVITPNKETNG